MNQTTSADVLSQVADILETRLPANGGDPETSYVARLFANAPDAFLKKSAKKLVNW